MHLEMLWCATNATFHKLIKGHKWFGNDVNATLNTFAENNNNAHRFKGFCHTFWNLFKSTILIVEGLEATKAWGELEH